MGKKKYVRVRVIARQMVSYNQILTFTREDWEEFKKLNERDAGEEIAGRLDLRDIADAQDIDDFEATAVGRNDKPIKPEDSYTG